MKQGVDIQVGEEDGVTTISVSGAIDTASAEQLKARVAPLCAQSGSRVLLDFSGLTYINSLCMGQLSAFAKNSKANGGSLIIYGVEKKILEIMRLLHLHELVSICDSRDEALQQMGR
jgi:anti-anti-sigma factor